MRLPPRRPGRRDGRCRNIDSDFFERIVADRCGFSGDGKFGNSERETSEMLLLLGDKDDYRIHFTYQPRQSDN